MNTNTDQLISKIKCPEPFEAKDYFKLQVLFLSVGCISVSKGLKTLIAASEAEEIRRFEGSQTYELNRQKILKEFRNAPLYTQLRQELRGIL